MVYNVRRTAHWIICLSWKDVCSAKWSFWNDKNKEKGWTQFNHGRITRFQQKLCTVDVGFADRLQYIFCNNAISLMRKLPCTQRRLHSPYVWPQSGFRRTWANFSRPLFDDCWHKEPIRTRGRDTKQVQTREKACYRLWLISLLIGWQSGERISQRGN